jgi:O-antigen biosynthesis protein
MEWVKKVKFIVWRIFPPESKFEVLFRTQFHRVTSTRNYVNFSIRQSVNSYSKYLKEQGRKCNPSTRRFPIEPRVTFLLTLENKKFDPVRRTIQSLQSLKSTHWELILLDLNSSPQNGRLHKEIEPDSRIQFIPVKNFSLASSFEYILGEYFICCQPGDTFESYFIDEFYKMVNSNPDGDIVYSDMDEFDPTSGKPLPFFKPSLYSPELVLSINYFSRAFIKRNAAEASIRFIDPDLGLLNQEWELMFLMNEGRKILRYIPMVLVHQIKPEFRNEEQENRVIESHLRRIGITSKITVNRKPQTHIRWEFDRPTVSIIIPTRNRLKILKNLVDSILQMTDYPKYEILLVDNHSNEAAIQPYYSTLTQNFPVRIFQFNEPFNYSRAINLGASISKSDLLLLINNDMQIIHSDWLTELCQWAMFPEIGIVGAKLLHANDTIQHAGIV